MTFWYQSGDSLAAEQQMNALSELAYQYRSKYISPVVLRKLYRQFCKWRLLVKRSNGFRITRNINKRLQAFESDVVHYLLERCYWIRYGDSDVVADLLFTLFKVDGHLGKIFDYQQLSVRVTKRRRRDPESKSLYFASTWTDEDVWFESIKPMDYFMEHAYKKKLLFSGKRFAEHHIIQCIKRLPRHSLDILILPPCSRTFIFPDVLPKLLRYGLFANGNPKDGIVEKLLTGIIGIFLSSVRNSETYIYPLPWVIEMGNTLLRAVISVNIFELLKDQKIQNRTMITCALVDEMSARHLFPKLKQRCGELQELQHMCRYRIRQQLYENWQLPHGISFLSLPNLLKEYLNLERD
ncbi:uncharacterized protein LOC118192519 isoform X2 [Stegodyphus dumicola]|uniref:uncharacterized protein LOC118192519 isoform X2 n=1 Tax=Stegodyphus dumicola TaxID=202533 RepID=UPI0015AC6C02|nr:uncharacterized protein LOC118192519 isoform X2 [Stegodyphus dumicola]